MLPDDSFIVKLLCIYRFYPDSIDLAGNTPLKSSAAWAVACNDLLGATPSIGKVLISNQPQLRL